MTTCFQIQLNYLCSCDLFFIINFNIIMIDEVSENQKQIRVAQPESDPNNNQQVSQNDVDDNSYAQQYLTKMKEYQKYSENIFQNMLSNLKQQYSIKYHKQFTQKLEIQIIEESINKQVIILHVKWGNFSMNISILNIEGVNSKHTYKKNQGNYGHIYEGKFNKNQFIVKCIPIVSKRTRLIAIKQWFLMKLASIAGIGPRLESYFGFDILMFSQCIQFGMEICSKVSVHNSRLQNFYQNLSVLHKLHIVHQDFKPENIMYSQSMDRPVFIDYGLSKIIPQKIGVKTLSNYVGSFNYWSPQILKCFRDKKSRMVDLYYNDLFGLQKSIQALKDSRLHILDEQPWIFEDIIYLKYLSSAYGKYLLYQHSFEQFLSFYKSQTSKVIPSFISLLQNQVINFIEELYPTKDVKQFFKKFVDDKHKQTPLYCKLNTLFQISEKNICSIDAFRKQDKYIYFSDVCDNILSQKEEDTIEENINQKMYQFITDIQAIKQTPFEKYAKYYLDFISYSCNKYEVSPQQRYEAAKAYHQIFICVEDQVEQSRKMVITTIQHSLKLFLNNNIEDTENSQYYSYLLFKLYDFLIILDMGTSQQFLQWIQKIYHHSSMTQYYQKIFVMRVHHSNYLNMIRLNTKKDTCRSNFILKLRQWVSSKINNNNNYDFILKSSEVQFSSKFNLQFRRDYASQTFEFARLDYLQKNQNQQDRGLINLYYRLLKDIKYEKIIYFLPLLNRDSILYRDNHYFSSTIQKTFRSCFRDDELMKQFSFYLENQLILKKFIYNARFQISRQYFVELNQYLKNIDTYDLWIFQRVLLIPWNRIQYMQYVCKIDLSFVYQKDGFIARMFQSIKYIHLKNLKDTNQLHNCDLINDLYRLLVLSKKISRQSYQETLNILYDKQLWMERNCCICMQIRQIIIKIDKLLECLIYHSHVSIKHKTTPCEQELKQAEQIFALKYNQFCKIIQGNLSINIKIDMVQRGMLYGLLFCSKSYQFEKKLSGIYNYHCFLEKHQMFNNYFEIDQHQFKLPNILWLLKNKGIVYLANFLYKLSQLFAATLMIKWFEELQHHLLHLLLNIKQQQVRELYFAIKNINIQASKTKRQCSYICLIYVIIFVATEDNIMQGKSISSAFRSISDTHFNFRRKMALLIYNKLLTPQLKLIKKRKWLSYNNKLVKLLMIDNLTVKEKKRKLKGDICLKNILIKMRNIEVFKKIKPYIKFSKK